MTGHERIDHRPQGIFDVRDHYRERRRGDGLAETVTGPLRFAVEAVVSPAGRLEPLDWTLETRPTLSGLAVFADRIVAGRRPSVVRTLAPSATGVEVRVSCPRFQARDVTFTPGTGARVQVDLLPAVDYPFDAVSRRPDEQAPTLLRGSVRDENDHGVPASRVWVQEGLYDYRTEDNGAWVIVLPDDLTWTAGGVRDVDVEVTLTPDGRWQRATPLPAADGAAAWSRAGLVMTTTVAAVRGTTVGVPELRLRLT
jgi:hypothetical protein